MKKIRLIFPSQFLFKRALKIEKRLRFIISTVVISSLMLLSTFYFFDKAWFFLPVLAFFSYFFTYFSVLEDIKKTEWLFLFIMPVFLTVSFYLFYFLFPIRWLTRIPFIIFYTIAIYANLLASNIFNVKMERSLQLYRAAFSVNFLFQTIIIFLFFNSVFSFRFHFFINALLISFFVFFLSLQLFWTVKMELNISKELYSYATLVAIVIGQITVMFSFIDLRSTIIALFLTATYYSLGGVIYSYLDQRLFKETIREYLTVWIFVLIITILSLR